MKKKIKIPWYVWLSLIALALIWGDTARRIKVSGKSLWDNFELWVKACVNMFMICMIYVIVPIIVFALLVNNLFYDVLNYSFGPEILMSILLIAIYFLSVFAVCRHIAWRNTNISHLLDEGFFGKKGIAKCTLAETRDTQKNLECESDDVHKIGDCDSYAKEE